MNFKTIIFSVFTLVAASASAAVMTSGYTVGSGLLSPNGETLFVDAAAAGGSDANDNDGYNDNFTVLIDGAGHWLVGDTVEITGFAVTVHNASANGTMTFDILQGVGGAGDTGAGGLVSLGSATASYGYSGSTETVYVNFDTPVSFVADTNSTKIGINISNSAQLRLKYKSTFPVTRYNKTTGNANQAMNVSVAGKVYPLNPINTVPEFKSDPFVRPAALMDAAYAGSLADAATDADGDLLSFFKVPSGFSGPGADWLSISTNGVLSGLPGTNEVGINSWVVEVTDNHGGTNEAIMKVYVRSEPVSGKPNILYILADDLGYADIGANGWAELEFTTPHIDSIFNAGVRCKAGLVSNSVCAPSRAGLMTGRSGSRFGFESNLPAAQWDAGSRIGLDPTQKTIPDVLKTAGYKTFGLGKWHIGGNTELFHPNLRGFDEWYGLLGGSRSYWQVTGYNKDDSIEHNGVWVQEPADMYITDFLTDQALDYIADQSTNNPAQPWFMYMSYTAPHAPMHAKASDLARVPLVSHFGTTADNEKRQIYGGMVVSLDDNVGRLLDQLELLGIAENTMVVFHSDNGGPPDQNWSRNNPLRGKKGELWEGGIRVPFAISWPGTIPAGQVADYDSPVSSLDLMPTFAAISGADQLQEIRTDGINLMPFLTNAVATTAPRKLYWRRGDTSKIAIRSGDYKYYYNRTTGAEYLFNHGSGSGEWDSGNKANSEPAKLAELQAEWAAYEATITDPHFNAGGPLLAVTTYDLDEAQTNTPYSMPLTYSTPGPSCTWSIVSDKPDWLSINPVTGELSGTPSVTNAYYNYIQLQVSDGSNTSTYNVPLRIPDSNNIGLEDWKAVHRISDLPDSADPDKDGVPNLVEYALGGNPVLIDQVEMPSLAVGTNSITYKHLRRSGQALNYEVMVADNLFTNWISAPVADIQPVDRGDGFEQVFQTLEIDPGVTTQKFVRLDISESTVE
ncbi:sulfatase-like hydrolase/transferase [Pontiellaceae bacterium B12227]|nr:sulfatase-like hydrolase/transferase [Pontiellaceae bacterium B12227]